MSVKPNTAKTANTEEKTVPGQQTNPELVAAVQSAVAADNMVDALKKVEDQLADGVTVKIKVGEDGKVELDVVESGKTKKLVAGAKGVFQRNKKLVLATGGLLATSVLLKVLANRQASLEADEVVESSDEINTEA